MSNEDDTDDLEEFEEATTPEGPQASPEESAESDFVEYGIEDKPPLLESIFLGFQHYLTMIGATVAIPLALISVMSLQGVTITDSQQAQLIGTFFVVSGVATLAQTTIGNRYPLVQGGTFSMLAPAIAIIFALTADGAGFELVMRELQGAIIVAALAEVVIGYAGIMGTLKRYLSPVVIAPVIALIGLALFNTPQIINPTGAETSQQNWWLLGLTLLLIVAFSQYLDKYSRYVRLFPVLLGIVAAWIVAAALSFTGMYSEGAVGYVNFEAVTSATLIQPVTPLQWGMPEFTPAFAIGMFAGVVASMVESFGDYHAVARLSGVSAPSKKRINHGIGMEGLGNMFAGVMGTGNGSTSYSENIGAIGITGVASRYVVQVGAIVMLVVGYVGYFGQLVATIPAPIVGGLFIAMFGQIAAVGLSNLKFVDLDSSRNVFIIGISLFAGLAIPAYMGTFSGPAEFQTGMENAAVIGPVLGEKLVSDTIFVVGSTGMAVGGLIGFVLDNTIDGTREERGLEDWERIAEDEGDFQSIVDRLGGGSDDEPAPGAD
ncbi:uracil-xanthine permease family protein [Haloarchaeobius iranensis]|uniref:Xanthine/uracil permease n=1 Tax=Haloarchaeobius iranensis TaxID=996166 RepID=A0A1G9UY16_9EURY|nr:solute carrier family 23 protein [Haloarchaeobius iranensis]SDM64842.1 Xanthine/uracil permease [Haloarchaeobius iranensis]